MNFKKNKIYYIIIFSFLIIYLFINYLVFINSKFVCGKITGQVQSRGYHLVYTYKVDNSIKTGYQPSSKFIDVKLDSLKSIKCVKIEYSTLLPFFNRVVDRRVLK
jgi:hypothetical protein